LDWDRALEAMDGDASLLQMVAKTALEEIPQLMAAIREAVAHRNSVALRFSAHTLHGVIRYFSPAPLFEHVCLLEKTAEEGRMDDAPSALVVLENETERLCAALRSYISEATTVGDS
jgi:hypothetical protein